ncbi:SAV_915 family protein [Streptomyces sp. NPDC049813]|uniref:SAV_915 family protein n=1 Tax=Streptomyces sp. NPDC049813 TaxID=3365597 RepID=UPI0037BBED8C
MAELLSGEDPEPSERFPAGPLYVPVRSGPFWHTARLFRTPLGGRTAAAFTSERALAATLGPEQPWIRLAEPALRAMTRPLGVTTVTVDPQLTAPVTVVGAPAPAARRGGRDPRAVGALHVTGAAALVSVLSYWIG